MKTIDKCLANTPFKIFVVKSINSLDVPLHDIIFLTIIYQEERDAYIGQIFGLVTLGRAICLAKDSGNVGNDLLVN